MEKSFRNRCLVLACISASGLLAWNLIQPLRPRAVIPGELSWDPPTVPGSNAGLKVAAYLDAFNSGDTEELSQFVRGHFTKTGPGGSSLDERLRSQKQLYSASHGLDLLSVSQRNPLEVEIVARLRLTQAWRQMTFYFDDVSPLLINGIRIVPIDPPVIPQSVTKLTFQESLKRFLDQLANEDQFSGVVLVSHNGRRIFSDARGLADKSRGIPNTLETPFHYASVGKMFTAIAVAKLIESGKLSLDDSLESVLPEYPSRWANQITIDHMLTHRSGIPDFFEQPGAEQILRTSSDPQKEYQVLFASLPPRFAPGDTFEYSNSNYILLGAIVERLSGQNFDSYLKQHVFDVGGMQSTTLDLEAWTGKTPAIGYTELGTDDQATFGVRRPNGTFRTRHGSAAGGGITTANDMFNFSEALCSHQLLTPDMTARLLARQVDGPRPKEYYARGFMGRGSRAGEIFGHSGGYPGVDAQVDIYDAGWTVIVLANYEAVGEPVARYVETLISDAILGNLTMDETPSELLDPSISSPAD